MRAIENTTSPASPQPSSRKRRKLLLFVLLLVLLFGLTFTGIVRYFWPSSQETTEDRTPAQVEVVETGDQAETKNAIAALQSMVKSLQNSVQNLENQSSTSGLPNPSGDVPPESITYDAYANLKANDHIDHSGDGTSLLTRTQLNNEYLVKATKLVDLSDVTDAGLTTTKLLKWDGTNWVPANDENTTYTAENGVYLDGNTFKFGGSLKGDTILDLDSNSLTFENGTVTVEETLTAGTVTGTTINGTTIYQNGNQVCDSSGNCPSSSGAWILAGDSGSSQNVAPGDTATFVGGNGLTSAASATDTLTFNVGAGAGISVGTDTVAVDQSYTFNWTGAQSWANSADFNGDISFADTDISFDGANTNFSFTGNFSVNSDDFYVQKSDGNVGINTTTPAYALDVNGMINGVNGVRTGDDFYVGAIGLNDTGSPTTSGASVIGVNDEFTNSTSTTVQAVLKDLDTAIAGSSHSPVTLAGAYDYLTLLGQQITLNQIDLTTDVTGLLPLANGGTNADLSGVSTGGLIYKDASGLAGSGSLTGVLKGNGSSAPTAMTGTANYVTRWTNADSLGTGVLYDDNTNVGIGTSTPLQKLDIQGALRLGAAGAGNVLNTAAGSAPTGNLFWGNRTICDSTGSCDPSLGNYWRIISGGISPVNDTMDFLIASTATSSAKFAVLNVNSGTPVASVSSGVNGTSAFLTSDGTLSTSRRMALTIGNSSTYDSTGNVLINPNGTGNVGIGTANPIALLDVNGTSRFGGIINTLSNWISGDGGAEGLQIDASGNLTGTGTLTVQGAGNSSIAGNLGVGTTSPNTRLDVAGYIKAPAATFSATYAGGTALTLRGGPSGTANILSLQDSTGSVLSMFNSAGNLGLGTTAASQKLDVAGAIRLGAAGSNNILNTTAAGGVPTGDLYWGDRTICDSSGSCPALANYWREALGAVSPVNDTYDFLIGSNATDSAKFAVLNVNNGTPVASVSSGLSGLASFLTADGTLSTANRMNLIIGNSSAYNTTGNVLINPNGTGNVGIGTTSPTQKLDIAGAIRLGTAGTNNILNTTAAGGVPTGDLYWGDRTICDSSGSCPALANYWRVALGAVSPVNDTLDLLIGSNATDSAKFAVLNVNSGTPLASVSSGLSGSASFLTADGSLSTTGRHSLTIGNSSSYNSTGNVLINSNGTGNVGIGTTNPVAQLDVYTTSSSYLRINEPSGAFLNVQSSSNSDPIVRIDGTGTADLLRITDNGTAVLYAKDGGNIGVGTSTPNTRLDIAGYVKAPAATFSATYAGGTALTLRGRPSGTANILSLQDSTGSVLSMFNNVGNLGIGTSVASQKLDVAGAIRLGEASTDNVLNTTVGGGSPTSNLYWGDRTICDSNGSCGGAFTNYWRIILGAMSPVNDTLDLLVGATSTDSAKFAVLNVNSGTPNASVSSGLSGNASYLTADGTIATTRRQSLIIGNSSTYDTTGNVLLQANGTGNVGIGTTAPAYTLQANGTLAIVGSSGTISTTATGNEIDLSYAGLNYIKTTGASSSLNLETNGNTDQLALASSGNVGIGTSNPSAFKLQVAGSIGPQTDDTYDLGSDAIRFRDLYLGGETLHIGTSTTDEGTISYNTSTNILGISTDSTTNGDIAFFTDDLYLDKSAGNVGIGSTTPAQALDVVGNVRISGLTASMPVKTNASKDLISAAIDLATSDVTGLLPLTNGGTNADLSGVSSGGLIYKGASALAGSGSLTGVLKGNGSSAPTAMTGSTNYVTRWTDANTLGTGVLYDNGTNVGISTSNPANFKLEIAGSVGPTANNTYDLGSNGSRWANVYATNFYQNGNVVCDASGNCGASFTNYWRLNLGTVSPVNDTLDLLVGANSTASAKFAVLNVNSGTPIASVSSGVSGTSMFMTADGTLGTQNRRSLTIGNSSTYNTTGNVLINSNGVGNVAIGTTAPTLPFSSQGLQVSSQTTHASIMVDAPAGSSALFAMGKAGSSVWHFERNSTDDSFRINESGVAARLVMLAGGNTGIGTDTTPDNLFTVGSSSQFQINSSGNIVAVGGVAHSISNSSGALIINANSTANLNLQTNGGNVGIGTTAASTLFHAYSSTDGSSVLNLATLQKDDPNTPIAGGGAGLSFKLGRGDMSIATESARIASYYTNVTPGTNQGYALGFYTTDHTTLSQKMTIQGDGNVGIGTTTIPAKLTVQESVDGESSVVFGNSYYNSGSADDMASLKLQFWYQNAGRLANGAAVSAVKADNYLFTGNNDAHLAFSTTQDAVLTEQMRITSTGNVGIGTSVPSAYFHGGTNRELEIQNPGTSANSQAHIILSSGVTANAGSIGSISWMTPNSSSNKGVAYIGASIPSTAATNASGNLFFATANAASPAVRMTILSNGNVGIGDSSPDSLFTVGSTSQFQVNSSGNIAAIGGVAHSISNSGGSLLINANSTANLYMQTNGGNVGIGTTTANAVLTTRDANALGSTAGNSQIVAQFSGTSGGNLVKNNLYLYRDAAGSDWLTTRWHDGLAVDASFGTPGTNTKTWWERDPNNDIQSWGTGASTYMTLTSSNLTLNNNLYVQGNQVLFDSSSSGQDFIQGNVDSGGTAAGTHNDLWMQSRFDDIVIQGGVNDSNLRTITLRSGLTHLGLTVDVDGNVGIGTTDATVPLHIYDTNNGDTTTTTQNTSTGTAGRSVVLSSASGAALGMYSYSSGYTTSGAQQASGSMLYANGTAGLSIAGANATSGEIRFYTDGIADANQRMIITNGGNIGIGTDTASNKLVLYGTASNAAGPHWQAITSTDANPVFQQLNWTHDNIALSFDAHYNGSSWISDDAGSNFQLYKIGDKLKLTYDSGITAGNTPSFNDGLVLTTSGNVGIGSSSPTQGHLTIAHTETSNTASGDVDTQDGIYVSSTDSGSHSSGLDTIRGINVLVTRTGTMTGTTSHGATGVKTIVNSVGGGATGGATYGFTTEVSGSSNNTAFDGTATTVSGQVGYGLYVQSTGAGTNYGIYSASGTNQLVGATIVNNTLAYSPGTTNTNTAVCRNTSNQLAGCTSLLKYKDNVQDISLGLDTVMKLRPVQFTWNTAGGDDIGFIAEEVDALEPILALHDNPGGTLSGVRYSQMTALLAKAIQEQQAQIQTIKNNTTTVALSQTGEVTISGQNRQYTVTPVGQSPLATVIGASQAFVAKINAGLISTKELIVTQSATIADLSVTNLSVSGQSINAYIRGIVQDELQNGPTPLPEDAIAQNFNSGMVINNYNTTVTVVQSPDASSSATFTASSAGELAINPQINVTQVTEVKTDARFNILASLITWSEAAADGIRTLFINAPTTFRYLAWFQGPVKVNADTSGNLTIPQDTLKARVSFSKPFPTTPTIYVSFNDGVTIAHTITDVNETGFTINFVDAPSHDITVQWLALLKDKDETGPSLDVLETQSAPATVLPTPTPTPSATPQPPATPADSSSSATPTESATSSSSTGLSGLLDSSDPGSSGSATPTPATPSGSASPSASPTP